jgi:hypothetical protein
MKYQATFLWKIKILDEISKLLFYGKSRYISMKNHDCEQLDLAFEAVGAGDEIVGYEKQELLDIELLETQKKLDLLKNS